MADTTWRRRLLSHLTVGDECWLWTAGLSSDGYAQIRKDGAKRVAHRLLYEWLVGPIPEGLELDHLCRVTRCLRPDHLEPVTHAENVRRGRAGSNTRGKTHCPADHPYDEANTYIDPDGRRRCRSCRLASRLQREQQARERRDEIIVPRRIEPPEEK